MYSASFSGAFAAMILAMAASAASAQSPVLSGKEVLEMCTDYPNGKFSKNCELYVSSMIEFANSSDKETNPRGRLCVGSDVPVAEVVSEITQWIQAHPELHGKSAFDASYGALARKYRCK